VAQGGHKIGHSQEQGNSPGKPDDSCNRFGLKRLNGAPDLIRTSDLLLRRQTLYPAELRVHVTRFYRTPCQYFGSQADLQCARNPFQSIPQVVFHLACQRRDSRNRARLYATGHGLTFQISAAYSAMVRSLENFPEPATFRIALRVHSSAFEYKSSSRRSASR
jgi:hypothetical protein